MGACLGGDRGSGRGTSEGEGAISNKQAALGNPSQELALQGLQSTWSFRSAQLFKLCCISADILMQCSLSAMAKREGKTLSGLMHTVAQKTLIASITGCFKQPLIVHTFSVHTPPSSLPAGVTRHC